MLNASVKHAITVVVIASLPLWLLPYGLFFIVSSFYRCMHEWLWGE
jgi:uncharacterized membrane protein YvlD (DUF360 family)